MRKIYYIGFYDDEAKKEINNIAGTMKMNFIIDSIKDLGLSVNVISIDIGDRTGFVPGEHKKVDKQLEIFRVPYFGLKIRDRLYLAGKTAWTFLRLYALFKFKKNDVVITYHSLMYHTFWGKLRDIIGFTWVPQVEELYCLSRLEHLDEKFVEKEERMFKEGDKFLFVNDMFAKKYANGKEVAVSYGNYNVFLEKDIFEGEKIGVVYTGIINQDRGAFKISDAMQYLPDNYELHILGYGTANNMEEMLHCIDNVNKGCEKVFYDGTRIGQEFTEYLSKYQIGISLMDVSEQVSDNAFPSKILAYMGHSLFVVSSKCSSIMNSRLADSIFFCDDTPQDIARAVLEVPVYQKNTNAQKLKELRAEFLNDLSRILVD